MSIPNNIIFKLSSKEVMEMMHHAPKHSVFMVDEGYALGETIQMNYRGVAQLYDLASRILSDKPRLMPFSSSRQMREFYELYRQLVYQLIWRRHEIDEYEQRIGRRINVML